jgi:hypothetical protein
MSTSRVDDSGENGLWVPCTFDTRGAAKAVTIDNWSQTRANNQPHDKTDVGLIWNCA